jgi:hypothetical protein
VLDADYNSLLFPGNIMLPLLFLFLCKNADKRNCSDSEKFIKYKTKTLFEHDTHCGGSYIEGVNGFRVKKKNAKHFVIQRYFFLSSSASVILSDIKQAKGSLKPVIARTIIACLSVSAGPQINSKLQALFSRLRD